MKMFKTLSYVLAVAGVMLMIMAFLGRFVFAPTVFGGMFRDGMSAASAMLGSNTLLLLAILAYLYSRK